MMVQTPLQAQCCNIPENVMPRLVLHFDVNQTLILKDTSKKVDGEQMLISILAEHTFAEWDKEHGKMSFKDYVDHVLLPGDKSNQELKQKRRKVINCFLQWLEERKHPARETVMETRDNIKAKFTDPKSNEVKFGVFASFYKLLQKLRENNIQFVVLLRTFGKDLDEVTAEIAEHPAGIKFERWGKFTGKHLNLKNEGTIDKVENIFKTFVESRQHFAIQDNWEEWNKDGEQGRSGKPFFFEQVVRLHEVRNLSLFFDDNFTGEEQDIVSPVEVSGKRSTGNDLKERLIFQANPVQAILDDDYYIKLVNQAMLKNGYNQTI